MSEVLKETMDLLSGHLGKQQLNGSAVDSKNENEDDDDVNPWSVSSKSQAGVDYDKLIGSYHYYYY